MKGRERKTNSEQAAYERAQQEKENKKNKRKRLLIMTLNKLLGEECKVTGDIRCQVPMERIDACHKKKHSANLTL